MVIFVALSGIAFIIQLVCCILIVVKLFQEGKTGLGILGIFCGLFTFIYGWINADRLNVKKIMLIWSVALAVNIVCSGLNVAMAPHQ